MAADQSAWKTRHDFAVELARAGGKVLMNYFRRKMQIELKGSGNLVSEADLAAEQTIVNLIRQQFPDDAIVAEEGHATQKPAPATWIIDPLDGTNNFAHGLAQFAISIAYYEEDQPVCGAIYNPAHEELYTALRGQGAFRNGETLRVSDEATLGETMISTGFYYDRGEIMRRTLRSIEALFGQGIHGIRRFGAASLDLCGVAAGEYGGYFEYFLSPWDFAAGRLIVEEAGGRVTDCSGNPLHTVASPVLASNSRLHQTLIDLLASVP